MKISLRKILLLWVTISIVWVGLIWTYGGTCSIPADEMAGSTDPVEFLKNQQYEYCVPGYETAADEERIEFCDRLESTIQRASEDPSVVSDTFSFEIVPLPELLLLMFIPPAALFLIGFLVTRKLKES